MTRIRFIAFALILALFAGLLAAVSADDDSAEQSRPANQLKLILQEATGLDAAALRAALAEGATPAELIEANDGDVDAVIATMADQASSAIEAAFAERVEELSDSIASWLGGERGKKRRGIVIRGSAMLSSLEEATGLDAAALREALAEGATPAELIEANDGDVDALQESLVSEASGALAAQQSAQLEELEDQLRAWLHGERGMTRVRMAIGGSGAQAIMEEATGLDAAALREALEAGATPTELIEANGGDVSQVMDALFDEAHEMRARMHNRFDEMRTRFEQSFGKFARGIWGGGHHKAPRG